MALAMAFLHDFVTFFRRHVWTVILVTMQPITDDIKSQCHCRQVRTAPYWCWNRCRSQVFQDSSKEKYFEFSPYLYCSPIACGVNFDVSLDCVAQVGRRHAGDLCSWLCLYGAGLSCNYYIVVGSTERKQMMKIRILLEFSNTRYDVC